jgi:SNF2 family DNA or RNA helicase
MYIHTPTKSVVLNMPDPFMLRALAPVRSRLINHPDYNVAIQHNVESTVLLRNMGFDVPAPIMTRYEWPGKYKPFAHQFAMSEFLTLNPRAFNLSEMGVAKTAASLWAADHLMNEGLVHKALILSPLSTLDRVWTQDIFDVLMHRKAIILHDTWQKRLEKLDYDVDFYILNHDGVCIEELREALRKRKDIDLLVVDEGGMFRNANTEKYKSLVHLIRPDMRVWWMTGTPCPNAPTDAWAQARIICPGKVPKFFGQFQRQTMLPISKFKWAAREGSSQMAFDAMQPAIRFLKKDCLDLPAVVNLERQAKLTKDQESAFKAMRTVMQFEAKTVKITAVNAADKINKLRQILCGSVKDPETDNYMLIPHAPRTEVLLEVVAEAAAKVIVIVPFKGIIRSLERELGKHYTVGVLNGDVPAKQRDRIISAFKNTDAPHILLCHPKVMSHGLNLTEADMTIFYAPIYSADEYHQVIERFNRAGQTRKMTVVRIGAHPIEWEIYRMVDNKALSQAGILRLYEQLLQKEEGVK